MANTTRDSQSQDMLQSIFAMQVDLNNHIFRKNDLRDNDGKPLSMQAIVDCFERRRFSVNDLPNQWLGRYVKAMEEELEELKDELLWKWWSKDKIGLQNIRVELVDLLHFLVSAMLCAGLTADELYDLYCQKHAVNVARQDSGYSKESKTEDDNRTIE